MNYTIIQTIEQFMSIHEDPNQPMLFDSMTFFYDCMLQSSFIQDRRNQTSIDFYRYDTSDLKGIKLEFKEIKLDNCYHYRLYSWSSLIRDAVSSSLKCHSFNNSTSRVEYHIISGEPEYYYFHHYGNMGREDGLYLIDLSSDIIYHHYRNKNKGLSLKEIHYNQQEIVNVLFNYNKQVIGISELSGMVARIKSLEVSQLAHIQDILTREEQSLIEMLMN